MSSRVPLPEYRRDFRKNWLRWVAQRARTDRRETEWGPFRAFDGYALAALAAGEEPLAQSLFGETLELMESNRRYEALDPEAHKWHLADFALHPLLRTDAILGPGPDSRWQALRDGLLRAVQCFRWHDGDLSENHNMLHWSALCLIAERWPDLPLEDGRPSRARLPRARARAREWMRTWLETGTEEWGADLYYNVNLLSLLNLADLSTDAEMRAEARTTLDWLVLDSALDGFCGASVGAARRSYSAYRLHLADSPSRPLHWLYWGESAGATEAFNMNFVGGVILAAVSPWRPPPVVDAIARDRENTFTHRATHRKGGFGEWFGRPVSAFVSRHTWRSPHGMISGLISPGGGDRFTEHVWQATLGEEALVFSNHPFLHHGVWKGDRATAILESYRIGRPGTDHRDWVPGNTPPGVFGDIRPGYWQGNGCGPRSFAWDNRVALVYDIPPDDPLPWVHLWFPEQAFDEWRADGSWLFARKGLGALAIWTSIPTVPRAVPHLWASREREVPAPCCGLYGQMDTLRAPGDFSSFIETLKAGPPAFDPAEKELHADGLSLHFKKGPRRSGEPVCEAFARFESPFGTLPHGETKAVWTHGSIRSSVG